MTGQERIGMTTEPFTPYGLAVFSEGQALAAFREHNLKLAGAVVGNATSAEVTELQSEGHGLGQNLVSARKLVDQFKPSKIS